MGRPREHDEATRARLIAAAEDISATRGWRALTVRAVAEAAGTSTRAVYALFDSKAGLEQALHEAMIARLRELLEAHEPTADPRADVLAGALAYRRWATERPERYALAIGRYTGPRAPGPRSPEGLAAARGGSDVLRAGLTRCQAAGLIVGRDVEELVIEVRAVMHGLAEFENLGMLGPDPQEVWLRTCGALLDGLAPPAAVQSAAA